MANAKFKRRSEIVRIVREKKQMSCVELSKTFGVTEETIRKDLPGIKRKRGAFAHVWRRNGS